jgi:hypothetical protein
MKNKMMCGLIGLVLFAGLMVIYGCGSAATSGGGSSGTTREYVGTDSTMGDVIDWTITDGAFSATIEVGPHTGVYISGTYHALASGVLSAEVTQTSSAGAISIGSIAYAAEFPNVVLFVGFSGNDADIMVCPAKATVTPEAGSYTAIVMPNDTWPTPIAASFVTIEVTTGTGSFFAFDFTSYMATGTYISRDTSLSGYVFVDGKLIRDAGDPQIFITPSGNFVGNNGAGNSGSYVGGKKEVISTSEALSFNYSGVINYSDHGGSGSGNEFTRPLYVERAGTNSNKVNIFVYNDPDSTVRTFQGTFEVFAQDATSTFPCTFHSTNDAFRAPARLSATKVNNKILLYGTTTIESDNFPLNFMLYQQ